MENFQSSTQPEATTTTSGNYIMNQKGKSASKKRKLGRLSMTFVDSTDSEGENNCRNKEFLKCELCHFTAQYPSKMKRHMLKHTRKANESLQCPMDMCSWKCSKLNDLDHHLDQEHHRPPIIDYLEFGSKAELEKWINHLQETEFLKYVRRGTSKRNVQLYYCNRSSHKKQPSKATGKRRTKKQGSIIAEKVCTSRFKVVMNRTGLKVTFHRNHYGHGAEPGKVGLTLPVQQSVARQIEEGVPKCVILEKLRASNSMELNRCAISNMQDIHNIIRKFGLRSDVRLHENNSKKNIRKRKEKASDNNETRYKPQGVSSAECPETSVDFLMTYMSEAQEHESNVISCDEEEEQLERRQADSDLQIIEDCYQKSMKLASNPHAIKVLTGCMKNVLATMERLKL